MACCRMGSDVKAFSAKSQQMIFKRFFISNSLLNSLVGGRTDFVPKEEDAEKGDARDGRDGGRLPKELDGRDKRSIWNMKKEKY